MDFRVAAPEDYDLLRRFRVECGWGVEKLEQSLTDPDRVVCVLERDGEDVGMGMWCLEYPPEKRMASRSDRVVHLASLFIRHKYQGKGYGAEAMDLLEREAVIQYNAEWITLDTVAFYVEHVDGFAVEDQTRPGRTIGWYNKRGYREFLVRYVNHLSLQDRVPLFPEATRDGGTLLLTAAFLRKRA